MAATTIRQRRETLERIVPTPRSLPAFDLARFQGLTPKARRAEWREMDDAARLRVAHAVMAAKYGHSTEEGAAVFVALLAEKFGG